MQRPITVPSSTLSAANRVVLLQLPEAFAETGLLPMHGAKLFEHAALRVVETLHNRG
jgi:hypothetical protein